MVVLLDFSLICVRNITRKVCGVETHLKPTQFTKDKADKSRISTTVTAAE